jgi:hypothetical protein
VRALESAISKASKAKITATIPTRVNMLPESVFGIPRLRSLFRICGFGILANVVGFS